MKIFVTRLIHQEAIDLLSSRYQVVVNKEQRPLTKEELIEGITDASALLCMLNDIIDREILECGKALKVIANYAVGINNIDIDAAASLGIKVTNTPGVLTEATADLTWALMMAAARRVVEADAYVRKGKFIGWDPMLMLGPDFYRRTIGIIGMGRIGQAVARRAQGFEMKVIYHNRNRVSPQRERELQAEYVSLPRLIAESDFISLHLPLTNSTERLLGENEFNAMKKTAVLVNTSRGPVLDEAALVRALQSGKIAAAALDVFENEPFLCPGLVELDNVVMVPHIGSATFETRKRMALMAAENILSVLRGDSPPNPVN